jgi:hypothetical protein
LWFPSQGDKDTNVGAESDLAEGGISATGNANRQGPIALFGTKPRPRFLANSGQEGDLMGNQPKLPKKGQKAPGGEPYKEKKVEGTPSKKQHGDVHDTARRPQKGRR